MHSITASRTNVNIFPDKKHIMFFFNKKQLFRDEIERRKKNKKQKKGRKQERKPKFNKKNKRNQWSQKKLKLKNNYNQN